MSGNIDLWIQEGRYRFVAALLRERERREHSENIKKV